MKPDEFIYRIKITAGLSGLAFRTKMIWITGVLGIDQALQTAISWSETYWYPDWLMIEVIPLAKDYFSDSNLMVFKRQFPTFYQVKVPSECVESE